MPKVICPCVECKYNGSNHRCKASYLRFKYRYAPTLYNGHAHIWECDLYELSDEAKMLEQSIRETYNILKNRKD